MAAEPLIHVEYISLPDVKLTKRQFRRDGGNYPYALLLAQIRPHLKTKPPQPFTQYSTGDYRNKVFDVLKLAMDQRVQFCVLPEFSLAVAWIGEIRERIHRWAPPNSIFCLPLEHFPIEEWPAVLKAAGMSESESASYFAEFHPAIEKRRLNVCWVCAKGEEGFTYSHFQAKLFPAIAQEGPHCAFPLQGGRIIRVFATGDTPALHFAVLVCYDFIAGGPDRASPLKELQNFAANRSLSLDWLFVPQFNPKPTSTDFKEALQQSYLHARPPTTLTAWANVAGNFLHPYSGLGVFGRSCLVAPLVPDPHNPLIRTWKLTGHSGHLRQLAIIAEEDVLILYADKLPSRRMNATLGEGRGYGLDFYQYAPPESAVPPRWERFNPHSPPWSPGFYRTYVDLLEGLAQCFKRELSQHLSRGLPQPIPYVDLRLEQGEIPPELPYVSEREGKIKPRPKDLKRLWQLFRGSLLAGQEKYLLIGELGSGKTSLLLWLAVELVEREHRIPFYLNLRDLGRRASYDALKRKFQNYCAPLVPASRRGRLFDELLDTGRMVFLLDGLDQMPVDTYEAALQELLAAVKNNAMILATRPTPARFLEDRQDLKFLRLRSFDQDAQRTYFGEVYEEALRLVSKAPDLAAVPMLAYLVRELIAAGQALKVETSTGLYEAFVDHVFCREKRQQLQAKATRVRKTLQALAFFSLAKEPPQLGYANYEVLEEHNEGRVREKDLLCFGLVNSLVERGPGEKPRLFFTHQSFQEFLASQYASEHAEAKNLVLEHLWQPRWREVLKFLVGLDKTGQTLAALYPGPNQDNVIHSRLFLAADCLSEDPRGETAFSRDVLNQLDNLICQSPFDTLAVKTLVQLNTPGSREILERHLSSNGIFIFTLNKWRLHLPIELSSLLIPYLEDENTREEALTILGDYGERLPEKMIQKIAYYLDFYDEDIRYAAVTALGKIGSRLQLKVIWDLMGRLGDEDWEVHRKVIEILSNLGEQLPDNIIRFLIQELGSWYWKDREIALEVLGRIGERLSDEVIQSLFNFLEDENSNVRQEALRTLRKLRNRLSEEDVIGFLSKSLSDEDMRYWAICGLGELEGKLPEEIIRYLVLCIEDEDWKSRLYSIRALGRFKVKLPEEVIRALEQQMEDENSLVRSEVVESMGNMWGWLTEKQIETLCQKLDDKDYHVRNETVKVLEKVGERLPEKIIWQLVQRLDSNDNWVRRDAVKVLGSVGKQLPQNVIGSLAQRLKDNDQFVRSKAAVALGEFVERLPEKLISSIWKCLGDDYWYVRGICATTLGRLGKRVPEAVILSLAHLLEDGESFVRISAVKAIGNLGERVPEDVIKSLALCLRDKDWGVRKATAETLGNVGKCLPEEVIRQIAQRLSKHDSFMIKEEAFSCMQTLAKRDKRIWSLNAQMLSSL